MRLPLVVLWADEEASSWTYPFFCIGDVWWIIYGVGSLSIDSMAVAGGADSGVVNQTILAPPAAAWGCVSRRRRASPPFDS